MGCPPFRFLGLIGWPHRMFTHFVLKERGFRRLLVHLWTFLSALTFSEIGVGEMAHFG